MPASTCESEGGRASRLGKSGASPQPLFTASLPDLIGKVCRGWWCVGSLVSRRPPQPGAFPAHVHGRSARAMAVLAIRPPCRGGFAALMGLCGLLTAREHLFARSSGVSRSRVPSFWSVAADGLPLLRGVCHRDPDPRSPRNHRVFGVRTTLSGMFSGGIGMVAGDDSRVGAVVARWPGGLRPVCPGPSPPS